MGSKVTESSQKGVDAMIFGNKSVSHFGTGPKGLNGKEFSKWMKGAFEKHFLDKSIDYYVIDARKLTTEQKDIVKGAVKSKGEAVSNRTFLIE